MTNMGYFSNLESTHIITSSNTLLSLQASCWQGPDSPLLNYPRKLGTCLIMVSLLILSLYIPQTVVHSSLGSSLHTAVVLLGRKVNLHPSTPTQVMSTAKRSILQASKDPNSLTYPAKLIHFTSLFPMSSPALLDLQVFQHEKCIVQKSALFLYSQYESSVTKLAGHVTLGVP